MSMIEIHTGSKAFWLGVFFACLILDSVLKFFAGVGGMEKPTHYGMASVADAILVLIISVGWWFAE